MIYLGTLGRMIGIKCPASQQVSVESRFTFETSLEGRVKAQARPPARRTWQLGHSDATTPQDISVLTQFTSGAWGWGPFVFVSAEAQHTNLLSPGSSLCDPDMGPLASSITAGGSVEVASGLWMARSFFNADSNFVVLFPDSVPILPGVPVTGSAYVQGSAMRVQLRFKNAAGVLVQSYSSPESGSAGWWKRLSITQVPPAGAVYVEIAVSGVGRSSGPSATWTDTVQPWASGMGCPQAVVHGLSSNLVLASPGATYSNASLTVTEVG